MKTDSDQELLDQYHRLASETAFAELVRRHVNTVFSAAVRLLVDRHLAEDAVQQVFVALARNAGALSHRVVISGWLHRTTHNVAVMIIRREERRRTREERATTMADPAPSPLEENPWLRMRPHLDQAIAQLSETDRDAIALRFFDRKTAAQIGGLLGISEEAAQKRVTRALERLRQLLARRGVAVPLSSLSASMSTGLVEAAPELLAQTLTGKTLAALAAGAGSATIWPAALSWLPAHPVAAAALALLVLAMGTGGYLSGRAAARDHWRAVRWNNALATSPSLEAAQPDAPNPNLREAGQEPVPSGPPPRPSVTEVLAAAARHFRDREDPDAWAKGYLWMEQLRVEDVPEALRVLENYRHEARVHGDMAPLVIKVWAQTEPEAALNYALKHLEESGLGLSIEFAAGSWAKQQPQQAWNWYRELSDSGDAPIADAAWMWVPKHIYGTWAAHDPDAAVRSLQEIPYGDRSKAIFGIAQAARDAAVRPGILEAINLLTEENQKRDLARRVAAGWAQTEPAAAAEWAASLRFTNPAAKLRVMGEVAEEWWSIDRHAVTQWLLANSPPELFEQVQAGIANMLQSKEP